MRGGSLRFLKEPEPEVLIAGSVAIARLKATPDCQSFGLSFRIWDADPCVVGMTLHADVALNLEFEQSAWAQQPRHFAHVALDDFSAGDVLEDDGGIGEIELERRNYGKIAAIVSVDVNTGAIRRGSAGAIDHFSAHVHRMNFAEYLRQRAGQPSRAAADF